jgi:hypothetical protein
MRLEFLISSIVFSALICSCDKRTPTAITDPVVLEQLKPIALFNASVDSAELGQSISYINTSKKDPTQYYWIFNGGNPHTSTNANTNVKYDTIGMFDVFLKVKNKFGEDSILKKKLIKIYFRSDFSNDINLWNIEKNWTFSTSNNIPGNKGMLAYSVFLNGSSQYSDNASMSRFFSFIPKNCNLEFWYYIYSPSGVLNVKENGKVIGSISGFGAGVSKLPLSGGFNTNLSFDALLYQTSSIYITNIKITPR